MRNLSNYRKGQFFILTAIAIVTVLFFIGRWMQPLAQADTSSIVSQEEFSTFDNIKGKVANVAKGSDNCDDLNYNLQDFKEFLKNFAAEKNYRISFNYKIQSCSGEFSTLSYAVTYDLIILSDAVDARGSFTITS